MCCVMLRAMGAVRRLAPGEAGWHVYFLVAILALAAVALTATPVTPQAPMTSGSCQGDPGLDRAATAQKVMKDLKEGKIR
jgi:hypothetical protein